MNVLVEAIVARMSCFHTENLGGTLGDLCVSLFVCVFVFLLRCYFSIMVILIVEARRWRPDKPPYGVRSVLP